MFGSGWRRGAIVGLVAAGAALLIGVGAVGMTLAFGAPRAAHPAAPTSVTSQGAAARVVAQRSGAAPAAAPRAASGQAASRQPKPSRPAVPWGAVGPGWVLDTYSAGTRARPAPTTLYLVSPAGPKYPLFSWPASATPVPTLEAWAGSKTEALFQLHTASGLPGGYGELDLTAGHMTRLEIASATTLVGYTLPTGAQVLGVTQAGASATFARYTRSGALAKTLVTENQGLGAIYSPDGTRLAVPAEGGVLLVSNAGDAPERLAVASAGAKTLCEPDRWWNATTLLAGCGGRLWLVPDAGAVPSALTPVRDPAQAPWDLGDIDAWQLPSGLYLQSLGACGTLELNRQAANGAVTRVTVPGMTDSPVVVTTAGAQLLVEQHGCHGSGGQLAWYNPATGTERWLFTAGAGPSAVAYDSPENGNIS